MAASRKAADAVNSPGMGRTPVWDLVEAARDLWLEAKLVPLSVANPQYDRVKNPAKFAAEGCGLNEGEVRGLAIRFKWDAQAKVFTGEFKIAYRDALREGMALALDVIMMGLQNARKDAYESGNYYTPIRSAFTGIQAMNLMAGEATEIHDHNLSGLTIEEIDKKVDEIEAKIVERRRLERTTQQS